MLQTLLKTSIVADTLSIHLPMHGRYCENDKGPCNISNYDVVYDSCEAWERDYTMESDKIHKSDQTAGRVNFCVY